MVNWLVVLNPDVAPPQLENASNGKYYVHAYGVAFIIVVFFLLVMLIRPSLMYDIKGASSSDLKVLTELVAEAEEDVSGTSEGMSNPSRFMYGPRKTRLSQGQAYFQGFLGHPEPPRFYQMGDSAGARAQRRAPDTESATGKLDNLTSRYVEGMAPGPLSERNLAGRIGK